MQKVDAYFKRVFQEISPLQDTNGGNIIALQIENEYGSYGNDKAYLNHLREIMLQYGAQVPFFTRMEITGTCYPAGRSQMLIKR